MTIYSVWIFDRHCNCIYNREYSQLDSSSGTINSKDNEDTAKLLFGALFSLRNIARTLGDNEEKSFNNDLNSFTTGKYRAHFYETLSNLRFCILSDLNTRDLKNLLFKLSDIYNQLIIRNPLSQIEFNETEVISDKNFITRIDESIENYSH